MKGITCTLTNFKLATCRYRPLITMRPSLSDSLYTSTIIALILNPSVTARVKISQNVDILADIYSALKNRTLSNLTCSKYIYRSKLINCFWPVKALSGIVQGGENDIKNQSKMPPVCTFGWTVKPVSWLILTSVATCHWSASIGWDQTVFPPSLGLIMWIWMEE